MVDNEQLASADDFFARYEQWGYPQTHIDLPKAIRINTLRTTEEECIQYLTKQGFSLKKTSIPLAYTYEGPHAMASTLANLQGWVHMQELSSQIPPLVLHPQQQSKVLDIAAAPGSKTTQIAQLMNNTGTIIACDTVHERLQKLKSTAARLGCTNIAAYQIDGQYADDLLSDADYVLCDVPCSGNYLQQGWQRTGEDLEKMQKLQKRLIETAVFATKTGGKIVYSTCSLEIEENEHIIEHALKELPCEIRKISLDIGHAGLTETTKDCRRIWPTQDNMGAFFIALLERT